MGRADSTQHLQGDEAARGKTALRRLVRITFSCMTLERVFQESRVKVGCSEATSMQMVRLA
jgi:hypothetical protein